MIKYLMMFIALAMGMVSYSQTTYKGKIMDTQKNELAGATVQSLRNPENGVISGLEGDFEISLTGTNKVTVHYIGYKPQTVMLREKPDTIFLNENETALNEIVISANREQQQRSEVPASISSLSGNQIKESKAFGIEQLVNKVPGVFMATSKAAGNEQHFMAVRSPISTKSLFLYLEDGLPIRPTAVFNHNAMLEMNNTSFGRIEVLKGPASSIYGSEAIGGSFNFITKKPTPDPSGSLDFQRNDLGLSRYEMEYSQYVGEKVGIYLGAHYVQRKNGPIEHSDYEKFALTLKSDVALSRSLQWISVFDIIDYRSDMTGELGEADYHNRNYTSDETFTQRKAQVFRFRSTLDKIWNERNKTSFNVIFRNNIMDQNPSYRISQYREDGKLTGLGSGEINRNQFHSFVGVVQHKIDFDFKKSSLIAGISADYSPQKYTAKSIEVIVNPETKKNIDFSVNQDDLILNYEADILNYASYLQYEITPREDLKVTAALRYDRFQYIYDNLAEGVGPTDSYDNYDSFSPKLGVNYNFSKRMGIYINYSSGFSPPETSSLYRNNVVGVGAEVFDLKPSLYDNYEIGGYLNLSLKLKMDVALYLLEGRNTLVSLRNDADEFFYTNAGKTRSYGLEFGFNYLPFSEVEISHNGSFARHRYVRFFDAGEDYSNTERETAPSLLGSSRISYNPSFVEGLNLTAEHELVGRYNTSFEHQVDRQNGDKGTSIYGGHSIFNFKIAYAYKDLEVWAQIFNFFDTLYASRASYNIYQKQNTYNIGNPRALHLGVKYGFGQ